MNIPTEISTSLPVAEWSNLSALGCLILLILWFVFKGLPSIMQTWSEHTEAARRDYKEMAEAERKDFKEVTASLVEECRQQRQDFKEELAQHRQQSASLAVSGHDAVNGLTSELRELKSELKSTRGGL